MEEGIALPVKRIARQERTAGKGHLSSGDLGNRNLTDRSGNRYALRKLWPCTRHVRLLLWGLRRLQCGQRERRCDLLIRVWSRLHELVLPVSQTLKVRLVILLVKVAVAACEGLLDHALALEVLGSLLELEGLDTRGF